ncbi:hypothetical protein UY3_01601 [Chelonia mydas]|uniref:Uncharacterized protein n=1 Tax=Chelonia mydas TaxID=8469 RepID=M7BTL7_CHEMY|nr:hypothetical protein UY3_01601 [Chelonia mydas]
MSQPHKGKKSSSSKPAGAAGKGSRAHGDKKSGASSKPGDKKGSEATEMKPAGTSASQPPKTHTSGAASASKLHQPKYQCGHRYVGRRACLIDVSTASRGGGYITLMGELSPVSIEHLLQTHYAVQLHR